jgi:hypothetical protein
MPQKKVNQTVAHRKQAEQGNAGAQLSDAVTEKCDDLPQVAPLPPRLPCSTCAAAVS